MLLSAFENRNLLCHSSAWNVLKDLPFHSVKTGILTVAGLAFEIGSPISFLTFPPSFFCHCSATGPVTLLLLQPCPQACLPTTSALLPHLAPSLCALGVGVVPASGLL